MEDNKEYCFACYVEEHGYENLPFKAVHTCKEPATLFVDIIRPYSDYINWMYKRINELLSNYYYPSFEEIEIGYECEVNWSRGYSNEFTKFIVSTEQELEDIEWQLEDGCIEVRVLYLSKDQIIREGWEPYCTGEGWEYFKKDVYGLRFERENRFVGIEKNCEDIWKGRCTNINDLRFKCKELNIG